MKDKGCGCNSNKWFHWKYPKLGGNLYWAAGLDGSRCPGVGRGAFRVLFFLFSLFFCTQVTLFQAFSEMRGNRRFWLNPQKYPSLLLSGLDWFEDLKPLFLLRAIQKLIWGEADCFICVQDVCLQVNHQQKGFMVWLLSE